MMTKVRTVRKHNNKMVPDAVEIMQNYIKQDFIHTLFGGRHLYTPSLDIELITRCVVCGNLEKLLAYIDKNKTCTIITQFIFYLCTYESSYKMLKEIVAHYVQNKLDFYIPNDEYCRSIVYKVNRELMAERRAVFKKLDRYGLNKYTRKHIVAFL